MGKTWLITGCSEGGIGAAIARSALEAGNNVVVTARNTTKVADIIKDFSKHSISGCFGCYRSRKYKNSRSKCSGTFWNH